MKWLVRVWFSVNLLVLVHAMLAQATPSSGGELAMLSFLLNFPSSILTGIGLNEAGFTPHPHMPHSLDMLLIWTPFFTMGAAQWLLLKWLVRRFIF